ncbi:glycosyltransferase [Pseudomonas sp. BAY1663]|uniref:glycosyltransferase n=1 Tax=Pseudomonas sp. BAY1663 TaxID=1439940 RepID=UPI002108947A|nr:glycosyltransferase [Pseudomonas sp. BAY1663]
MNAELSSYPGWSRVDELGFIDREGIKSVMSRSIAGLVTLHPAVNYVDALPIKLFEYMSAGIPVVSSDFPLWREIVEGNDCGLCVDPLNPQAIADSIDFLVENPGRARQMGLNGQRTVNDIYNWSVEESKLFRLYSALN